MGATEQERIARRSLDAIGRGSRAEIEDTFAESLTYRSQRESSLELQSQQLARAVESLRKEAPQIDLRVEAARATSADEVEIQWVAGHLGHSAHAGLPSAEVRGTSTVRLRAGRVIELVAEPDLIDAYHRLGAKVPPLRDLTAEELAGDPVDDYDPYRNPPPDDDQRRTRGSTDDQKSGNRNAE